MEFVTAATDDFFPGVLSLSQSLIDNSGFPRTELKITVLALNDISTTNATHFHSIDARTDIVDKESIGEISFDTELLEKEHKIPLLNKMLVFGLDSTDPICYLDADQLCIGDITDIVEFPHLSVCLDYGRSPPVSIDNRPMFNSGFLVFQPSKDLFVDLQKFSTNYDKPIETYSDQRVLNEFFYSERPDEINIIKSNWNTIISTKWAQRKIWKSAHRSGVKFLHFTAIKPWMVGTIKKWGHRSIADTRRYPFYRREAKLWKRYYKRSFADV